MRPLLLLSGSAAARLITGKTLGGVGLAVGVPVAISIAWTMGLLRWRRSP